MYYRKDWAQNILGISHGASIKYKGPNPSVSEYLNATQNEEYNGNNADHVESQVNLSLFTMVSYAYTADKIWCNDFASSD